MVLFLPNVKDEPRPRPARLLRPSIAHSVTSFDSAFVCRRRDGRGRWLWRLVRRFVLHRLSNNFEISGGDGWQTTKAESIVSVADTSGPTREPLGIVNAIGAIWRSVDVLE